MAVVVSSNTVATPNNKLNLYNAPSGACIAGAAPAGPAATLWPVSMVFAKNIPKLFVLYYPFTGATSNAQVWSFTVSATDISGGTLVFDDIGGDIAVTSATPATQSGDLTYYSDSEETFLMVGTSANSLVKLNYDVAAGTATKPSGAPLIYNSLFIRTLSSVLVVPR